MTLVLVVSATISGIMIATLTIGLKIAIAPFID